jgi:hypothetical protein
MECKFHVGQRIVCINARFDSPKMVRALLAEDFVFPQYGEVYTVREVKVYDFWDDGVPVLDIGVYLKEIVNPEFEWVGHPDGQFSELPFVYRRFKPLDFSKRKTGIEVFNKILQSTKDLEPV